MKKVWLFSPFILSMFASPLLGDQKSDSEIAKSTLFAQKKLECSKKSCASCCPSQPDYHLSSEFNGLSTFAEYLIWQVQEQASHFVITPNEHSIIDPAFTNTEGLGTIRSAPFKWASGVRVGMGYTMERDAWQALAQYTWFSTEGKKTYSIPAPPTTTEFLMPTSYAQSTTGIESASSKVDFSYQMADLLAGRTFLVTEQIRLNFAFGGTGGYIKEDFHITYGATNNTYIQNDWSFGGGGFRAALDSNWHIGYGFGVFGRFSFATILGHYSNSNRITADDAIVSPSATPPHIASTNYQTILLMPTTQIALGFDWCKAFDNCGISAVRASVAGEFNNLANLHQVFKVIDFPSNPAVGKNPSVRDTSSVYMYGANVRVGLDY